MNRRRTPFPWLPALVWIGLALFCKTVPAQEASPASQRDGGRTCAAGSSVQPTPARGFSGAICGVGGALVLGDTGVGGVGGSPAFATSDHILRESLCLASSGEGICAETASWCGCSTCWYDRVYPEPCYADSTKIWTISEFAAVDGDVGAGTYDGLYVFPGFAMHIYRGLDGGQVEDRGVFTGPEYFSCQWWSNCPPEGYKACDGFEPGTVLFEGGAGCLELFSFLIGPAGALEIEHGVALDLRLDSNNNGLIDMEGDSDERVENEAGLNRGLLLPVNNNDTDENGRADHLDVMVNGVGDRVDLREARLLIAAYRSTGDIVLDVESPEQAACIRVYDEHWNYLFGAAPLYDDGTPVGPHKTRATIPLANLAHACDTTSFYLEGVQRGVVRLRASFDDTQGSSFVGDTAKIVVYRVDALYRDEEGEYEQPNPMTVASPDDWPFPFVTDISFVDEAGNEVPAEDGSRIKWAVAEGAATLSKASGTTINGFAGTLVTVPSTAGSTFRLSTRATTIRIDGDEFAPPPLEHRTPDITVLTGAPAHAHMQINEGVNAFPASQANELNLTISATDAHGNAVQDGTELLVDVDGGSTVDEYASDDVFVGGTAHVRLRSGFAPGPNALAADIGPLALEESIEEVPIDISLNPSAAVVTSGADNHVDITATVLGADGSAVADGTEIVWLTSLGSVAVGGVRAGPVAVGTVNNGQASVRLYTACTDGTGQVLDGTDLPGTARIIAAIGYSQSRTQVEFESPAPGARAGQPLRLEAEHRALAGDATSDGTVFLEDLSALLRFERMMDIGNALGADAAACPHCDLDEDGVITLVDLVRARGCADPSPAQAPYWAQTAVTIHGDPEALVQISVSQPSLVLVSGVDALGRVTLNAQGQATITVQSLGVASANGELEHVKVTATVINPAAGRPPNEEGDILLILAPKDQHGRLYNLMAGSVWGGGEGASAFAGDTIVSFFLVGDIRDCAVETLKLWPGGEDPSKLVFTVSAIGIITSVAPPADAAIAVLKRVLKIANRIKALMPKSRLVKHLGKVVTEISRHMDDGVGAFLAKYDEWKTFFKVFIRNSDFVQFAARMTEDQIRTARRVLARFGESWAGHLVKAATNVGQIGAKRAASIIDAVDEATVKVLKGWPAAKQEKLVLGLAGTRGRQNAVTGQWDGAVEERILIDLLQADKIKAIEDTLIRFQDDLGFTGFDTVTEMLGKVSRKGTENTQVLAQRIGARAERIVNVPDPGVLNQLKGDLNELKRLAQLADDPNVKHLRYNVNPLAPGVQDLDGVAVMADDSIHVYEFKSGKTWTTVSSGQKEKLLKQIERRVDMCADPEHALHGAIIHVQLTRRQWNARVKQEIEQLAEGRNVTIIVETVP